MRKRAMGIGLQEASEATYVDPRQPDNVSRLIEMDTCGCEWEADSF